MGYVAQLKKGTNYLDLTSGRYTLSPNFVPPSTNEVTNIALGTSANRRGGGKAIGRRAIPRSWGLDIRIVASSNGEAEKAISEIEYMLQQAGDENEPLYFVWRPHNHYSFEPLWGTHDAYRLIEILSADSRNKWDYYGLAGLRGQRVDLTIGLTINPYATTKYQRVGSATGGIFEDYIGQPAGRMRGLIVPENTTNNYTNPVYGHATWNTNWNAGTNLVGTQNTDKKFILFGTSSAKLVNSDSASARLWSETLTLTAAAYTLSFYVKRPDGAAVSSSDCEAYYNGSTRTTTFRSVGDGWYRASAAITGVASALSCGVQVKLARVVYVDGFQVEGKQLTALCYGDLPGSTWSSTPHASTSSRTAARYRIDEASAFDRGQGTIRIVWMPQNNNTAFSSQRYIFAAISNFQLAWNNSSNLWTFRDTAGNSASSGATTFTAGTPVVIHCVYGVDGLVLYINGSSAGSTGTYQPESGTSDYIYLGSDRSSANQINGTFLDFETFSEPMSATEVQNDYNNLVQISNDDQMIAPIPGLWTDDGDLVLDNVYDSNQENMGFAFGIPGDVAAETLWNMTMSAGLSTVKTLGLSLFDTAINVFPKKTTGSTMLGWLDYLYEEYGGTGSDAKYSGTSYGNNAWASAVGSNANSGFTNSLTDQDALREIFGREWCLLAKVSESNNNLRLALSLVDSSLGTITGDHRTITTAATFYYVHSGFLFLGEIPSDPIMDGLTFAGDWVPYPDVLSGTEQSDVDFAMVVPKPLVIFGNSSESNTGTKIIYRTGDERARVSTGAGAFAGTTDASGDREDFALQPNRINYIFNLVSLEGSVEHLAGRTTTFTSIYVKPRWAIA